MTPARVLVVEDDRIVARDIEQQLTRIGHTVVAMTARGEDVVALAVKTKPTLVLMDIRLEGEVDGIDAAEAIRAQCRIPVIFLTAYADDQTVLRASRAEPFGYLIKPFEDSQLRTAVEMALYKHAADQRVRESERRYAVTLESIGDAVIATDAAGQMTFMNPVAEALTGWTRTSAIGRALTDVFRIFNEETRQPVENPAVTVGAVSDTLLVTRDDRQLPIEFSAAPMLDDAGTVTGVVLVFRDIAQRRKLAEAELLRQTNARLEHALRGSEIGIWDFEMTDGSVETSRLHTVNFWEQHGYGLDTTVDFKDVVDRWHPDDRERVLCAIHDYLDGKTDSYEVECRIRQNNGAYRTRIVRGIAIRDASGTPTRFIGSSVDITERMAIEEALRASEERYRNTFENAPVGFVHTDFANHEVLRVNQTYCNMTGWSREELLGQGGMTIIHPDDRAATAERFLKLKSGELTAYVAQFRISRKDGSLMWVRLTVSIGGDRPDGLPYAIGIVQDISERQRLESALEQAKEAAEASNRAKDEFLANVSHEIRTPMNAILGMTELVLDTSLTETQRQSLRTVKSAAGGLLAIINDLLDFSKIEAGKLELDPTEFQLRALLGDAMRALAMRAHRKGLELLCNVAPDVPDALVGDAGRLRQVLINLVGNALKFTSHGEVQVDVVSELLSPTEVELRFAVRDTGIGIPSDKQETIFRAFEQEDMSTTRRYGGTGLGLTIASRLVVMMGGEITVDSTPRQGSTFSFNARFGWREHPSVPGVAHSRSVLVGLRVLIVDDNAANREILLQWLRGWRMEPTAVSDGLAAMDALWHGVSSRQPYALILLDARMPDTDGLAIAAKIRERAELAGTRIILLTSGDRPGDIDRIRELRVDAHVLKPVPQDELLDTIHEVITSTAIDVGAPRATPVQTAAEARQDSVFPLRVLVAEDNPFNSQLLRQLLTSRGHGVRVAGDGREALDLAQSGSFDLLLLDLHMPELDGFQVIGALREHERTRGGHLPVIALTARSRAEDRERCFDAGMDDFLAKPIQAVALWAAIERAMAPGQRRPGPNSLIAADVLLAVCGGNPVILERVREGLQVELPRQLALIEQAFGAGDGLRLREVAHGLAGMLSAVSTVASGLASELEDVAAKGDLQRAGTLIGRLRELGPELVRAIGGITIEWLESELGS